MPAGKFWTTCRCFDGLAIVVSKSCARLYPAAHHSTPTSLALPPCSASELPKPEVSLELKGYPAYTTPVLEHTLQPR